MSSNPRAPKSDPSLRPTSISVLIVAGLSTAALSWLLLSFFDSTYYVTVASRLPWSPTIVLAVLALAEGLLAQNSGARIQHKPGTLPPDPLAIARYVALAKASSLLGALSSGFSAGLLAWLIIEPTNAAHDDIPAAVTWLVSALALVGAALWLERACRIPEQPDQTDSDDPDRSPGHR